MALSLLKSEELDELLVFDLALKFECSLAITFYCDQYVGLGLLTLLPIFDVPKPLFHADQPTSYLLHPPQILCL